MTDLTPYQKEALNITSNILLTANAGSGKTFVLSKRFVEIILQDEVELDNIVAITFTDKAAGELNKKIAAEIESRLLTETDLRFINKLENVRRVLVSANISTIHSFCVNILREFAPEADIDADFNPIDQQTANELIELSIDETINELINKTDIKEELKYLLRLFGSKQALVSNLRYALHQRKIINLNLHELYTKSEKDISEYYYEMFKKHFNNLFEGDIVKVFESINTINDYVLKTKKDNQIAIELIRLMNAYTRSDSFEKRIFLLHDICTQLLTKEGSVKNQKYLSKNREEYFKEISLIENYFGQIISIVSIDNHKEIEYELACFGKKFFNVYEILLNEYSIKKKQRAYLDFEDILLKTLEIIKLEEVQEFLKQRYKYIMIDEYQDTNELQYNIFMPILDFLKHGNLFVVGDEKQSIYKFRDAELEVFNRTKVDINNSGLEGKVLELPHSFRMAPQLVLFTNQLFNKLFRNPKIDFNEVEYKDLICAKNENEKGSVEILLSNSQEGNYESDLVAGRILNLVQQGTVNYNEICILCRKRAQFKELENSFVKMKIPYTVVGGKGFYQKQSIYDIYNYISFLINQKDDTALLGILRSPFYNINDTIIFEISLQKGESFFDKLKNFCVINSSLKTVVEQLNIHIEITNNVKIYELLRRILVDRNYWAVVSAKRNASQEIANLNKLLQISRDYSKKSFKNLFDFVSFLKNAIEKFEDEGQAQIGKEENSVKLLTIHQAKGMEYKVVFLYGTNAYTKDDSVKSKLVSIDKNFGLLTKVHLNKNYFDRPKSAPIVSLYNFINYNKNRAELKRLLYVAVTRAMNYLFLSADNSDKVQKDSFWELISNEYDFNSFKDSISMEGNVKFIYNQNGKYLFKDTKISLSIPVIKDIEIETTDNDNSANQIKKTKYYINEIKDIAKKEIISATKISLFRQCPIKYQLTYELGYSTIYEIIKTYSDKYEFNYKEDDDIKLKGELKGRIIHTVLKENIQLEKLDDFITKQFALEHIKNDSSLPILREKIITDLKNYYLSAAFKELSEAVKYFNEYEIYCEEGEYYLYGIIDKLIIEDNRVLIVDYKTDDVTEEHVKLRAEEYFNQLKYYAYIVYKMFGTDKEIFCRLIFIKYPDVKIQFQLDTNTIENYRSELNNAIFNIHNRQYTANLNHCTNCNFALEGNKCVTLLGV